MTWLILIGGLATLAFFAFCFYWIFGIGKQIKEGEEMARLVDIERRHSESVKRWATDSDRIMAENENLKKEVRRRFSDGSIDVSGLAELLRRASQGSNVSKTNKK